ncbi:inosine-5'-monophosphate dehydrogenase [Streptomyces cinnamoneus]|uniref:Inosine-5'-monophosphate dehydrogenase n=1 Tax=Streptomyces cinnamoneus TaxID=53446 RepID=A0A2G1XP12_STRCJ|nr:CBS domain-containing protein [Streptomyces cinnamoneus]PHQ52978.1 inosine-5'-monophosphate dehydrogenase [Streptomyces cinnamoneus]PPT11509.1 CBS domain-containing protein [Streptomyces cinnamoneus]
MQHRTVGDLMTHSVVRVQRGTLFTEIVHVLQEHDITAVPVVDSADRPVGVVSEADLLAKAAKQPPSPGGRQPAPVGPVTAAKHEATTAEGLMTSPAVCARPEWSVVEAARTMERHRVKRLPVVDDTGRLVGLVSRGDLLRVFLRTDRAIRDEIVEDVVVRTLHESPSAIGVEVTGGQVRLSGSVRRKSLVPVLVQLCGSVDGVVSVDHHLTAETDDDASAQHG